ncbi:hypothetical protein ebA5267 [Aromatoleum aromaticum EbN1]|uniref:Uncharacterized protein n=1 Tax=Aromatoleum aromaticum (strain DSM 19018 / LMG 30748 / EbN1) TaxID=76114 RepID=Q5P0Q0_AROAE|nr:hypothetical protein ebA5267 [Aromatoleum aromaticum EbN1]
MACSFGKSEFHCRVRTRRRTGHLRRLIFIVVQQRSHAFERAGGPGGGTGVRGPSNQAQRPCPVSRTGAF